ncbi:MAG: hypothetical protein A2Z34_05020 [Planctomycetes bacterium RBG_16_59_8]|nr:MAG: hypothetical protein A2Z34_05020 [Planctomycetes bacterium RBG_16_59_8]
MRTARLINNLLWFVNLALCCAVAVFAFNFLIFPEPRDLLRDLPQEPKRAARVKAPPSINKALYRELWSLPNPLEKPPPVEEKIQVVALRSPLESLLEIRGTMPNQDFPERACAFLRYIPGNTEIFAAYGKPILDPDGKEIPDLQRVTLVEVYAARVVFKVGDQRVELKAKKEESGTLVGTASPDGGRPTKRVSIPENAPENELKPPTPYDPANYQTKIVEETMTKKSWEVDGQERDWIIQNQERVLSEEITLLPYAGGGVKIDAINGQSVVAARGFMPGDVVKSVNGKPVNSVEDGRRLSKDPTIRNAPMLSIVVDRAGQLVTVEYKVKK